MPPDILNPQWKIEQVYSEWTKFFLTEGQSLIIQAKGLAGNPVVNTTVPIGKDWIVHINIEIHEGPMNT